MKKKLFTILLSWIAISGLFSQGYGFYYFVQEPFGKGVPVVAMAKGHDEKIYVINATGQIKYYSNKQWMDVPSMPKSIKPSCIGAFDPNHIIVGTLKDGYHKFIDNTWNHVSKTKMGFNAEGFETIEINNSCMDWSASTSNGVLYSIDGGPTSFYEIGKSGLSYPPLSILGTPDSIFVGTSKGIWVHKKPGPCDGYGTNGDVLQLTIGEGKQGWSAGPQGVRHISFDWDYIMEHNTCLFPLPEVMANANSKGIARINGNEILFTVANAGLSIWDGVQVHKLFPDPCDLADVCFQKIHVTGNNEVWTMDDQGIIYKISNISKSTAVHENVQQNTIPIFPNPAQTFIRLGIPSEMNDGKVLITSLTGQLSIQRKLTGNSLDISELSSGMYQLSIQDNDKIYTGKVVVIQ